MPDDVPVFAATLAGAGQTRRPGVRLARLTVPPVAEAVDGLRLTRPVATLLDCGRVLGALDLAVVVGGAIDDGVDPAEIDAAAARRVRGAGQLRAARALLGERPESAMEVVLGAFCRTLRIPTETQRELRDGDDRFVARGDLWIAGTRTLVEYDGAVHLEPDAYADGLRRDRRINAEGWNRFAVTLSDLVGRSHRTARELYAAAGLEH
ncbi:MAG TPA: hypothetical protein VGE77_09490, partial [Nocardioides sp.]